MKLLILGAAGKLGQRLVARAVAQHYDVTAAVRDPLQFERLKAGHSAASLRMVQWDATHLGVLEAALEGQDAMVSAAGNVAAGQPFVDLFNHVVTAAERVMATRNKVWMLAGAAVLDIPHTQRIGISLPFVPAFYRPHLANLRRIERSHLDWSLMCPGPMVPADDHTRGTPVRLTVDTLPFDVGPWVRFAPPLVLSLVMKQQMPSITMSYEDVADAIINNLAAGGRFSRKRVGIGRSAA